MSNDVLRTNENVPCEEERTVSIAQKLVDADFRNGFRPGWLDEYGPRLDEILDAYEKVTGKGATA